MILNKKGALTVLAGILFFVVGGGLFAQGSPMGTWVTISDKDGKPKSHVQIFQCGANVCGKITKLLAPEEPNPKCTKCPGNFKDKPIEGLVFMWGLTCNGSACEGGQILDPQSGSIYKCKMEVKGSQLLVRGFLGVSLLGRTQTWNRL